MESVPIDSLNLMPRARMAASFLDIQVVFKKTNARATFRRAKSPASLQTGRKIA
jgi:hypothetical protein